MVCDEVVFSGHAIQRMFQRGIGHSAVLAVVERGEVVAEYMDDTPFPSRLLLGFVESRPVHVVVALDESLRRCFIVTAYVPRADQWGMNFKSRKLE